MFLEIINTTEETITISTIVSQGKINKSILQEKHHTAYCSWSVVIDCFLCGRNAS